MPVSDPVPESEQGDTGDHAVDGDLLVLHEALEALAAGFPPGPSA